MNNYPGNDEFETTERLSKEALVNAKRIFDGDMVAPVFSEEDDVISLDVTGTDEGLRAVGYESVELTVGRVELIDATGSLAGVRDILTVTATPSEGELITFIHTSDAESHDGSWAVARNYAEHDDDHESKDDEGRDLPITLKGVEELDLILASALIDAGSIQGPLPEEE